MPEKNANELTCPPREHDFVEMWRYCPPNDVAEPPRLFCKRCGWVREVPTLPSRG